jgi:sigma-E factor negative regulatory protein RseA
MSNDDRERISALVDGELDRRDKQALLEQLARDPDARARWGRYHLIGDALRNDLPVAVDHGLATRVSAALEREPTVLAPSRRWLPSGRPLKRTAGLAVAASLLGVAVLIGLPQNPEQGGVEQVVASSTAVGGALVTEVPRWDRGQPMVESRLNSYVVNHNEYSASTGMQGMLPYMRIVGADARERATYEGR